MRGHAIAFGSGVLFATGLAVAGMTQPARVVGFLDFAGSWDPTLAFVIAGAVAVMAATHRLARHLKKPLYGAGFPPPASRRIDARLVGGSALFGIGWGIGGFCPGPGVASLGALSLQAMVFVAAMAVGMHAFHAAIAHRSAPALEAGFPEVATSDR